MQYVLSTVVLALKENPDRRFSYAEMVSMQTCYATLPTLLVVRFQHVHRTCTFKYRTVYH